MKKDINEIMINLKKVANKEYYVEDLFCYEECQTLYDFIVDLQKHYNDNVNKYEELLVKYSNLQQKKIPEKLDTWYSLEKQSDEDHNFEYANYNFDTMYVKINEICDYLDYLKSKGE